MVFTIVCLTILAAAVALDVSVIIYEVRYSIKLDKWLKRGNG